MPAGFATSTPAASAARPRRGYVRYMPTQTEKAERFLTLHDSAQPLLMPNPWDRGSAALLASLGFEALATTSSGFAATLGPLDGAVSRDEAIGPAQWLPQGTHLPGP